MGDLFHEKVPAAFVDQVFASMARFPQHRFAVLTKRSERMRSFLLSRDPVPDHVWLGVTVEDDEHRGRLDDLMAVPARVRWISAEPLLGPLDVSGYLGADRLNFVACGPELGDDARPCDVAWMRTLRDQCADADVPFFTKHILDGERIRQVPA